MRRFITVLIILFVLSSQYTSAYIGHSNCSNNQLVLQKQILFNPNNILTWIQNTGIFNQDIRTNNTPGFMWLAGTNRFAVFTTGLTIGAKVNNEIRLASCSYKGEYAPGKTVNGMPYTDADFKLYKVNRADGPSNLDWVNWYKMIPFGAPYLDVNNNGIYDYGIDTPGVKYANQTVFICMTDGFPQNHSSSEGFSGGTQPLFSEMHLTAWGYNQSQYADIQFLKFEIINKGSNIWDSTYMGLVVDVDLGDATDDYIGCDTARNLGYSYNADNFDGNGNAPSYGANPPAVGFRIHNGVKLNTENLMMNSFIYFTGSGSGGIVCETDPSSPIEAYNYLKGIKRDGSYWFHPNTKQRTKKLFTGLPELNQGWTEFGFNGMPNTAAIRNCIGGDTITTYSSPPGDRRFCIGTGSANLKVYPNDTQTVIISQSIARGSNNLNSISRLRQLSDTAQRFYESGFLIGVKTEMPKSFYLYPCFPNPFNSFTNIKFDIPENINSITSVKIYDISGKKIATLIEKNLYPGNYIIQFDAGNLSSGIYFYRFQSGDFIDSKKMILIK